MSEQRPIRLVVIGIGHHGSRIARLAVEGGAELVGAVDNRQAGRDLAEVTGYPPLRGHDVAADLDELGLGPGEADIAIITAAAPVETIVDLALQCVELGLNVITIVVELFDPDGIPDELRERLDQAARAQGVSVVGTGSQDVSWGALISQSAAQVRGLTGVELTLRIGVDGYERWFLDSLGVGLDPVRFATEVSAPAGAEPSVAGMSVAGAARAMGLHVTDTQRVIHPVTRSEPLTSVTYARELAAGEIIGSRDVTTLTTREGVRFTATLETTALPQGAEDAWIIGLSGDPRVELEQRISVPADTVDATVLNRLGDLVAARPGLLRASELPPATYRPTLTVPTKPCRPH